MKSIARTAVAVFTNVKVMIAVWITRLCQVVRLS